MAFRRILSNAPILLLCVCSIWGYYSARAFAGEPELQVSAKLTSTDWPWWRGPTRDGQAGPTPLPTEFSDSQNVQWKSPVPGRGHSSPVVVGGQVYLTTADERSMVHSVVAFELNGGQQLWQQAVSQGGFPEKNHPKNTEASSTLAGDGERLYATFFHHQKIELVALDLAGQELWRVAAGPFNPKMFEYGYAPSPLLYGPNVIVVAEYDGQSFMAAYDRLTGDEQWRTPRPRSISFSSPVVAHVAGRDQLFLSGQDKLCSYDPSNGQLLWEAAGTTLATCGTAIWDDQAVYASGGFPKAETLGVRADGSKQVLWRNNQQCYEQSMILVDGCVYAFNDRGILYCWRASDGQQMWRERLEGPVSASPIYAGGHLYWANETGTVYVIKPSAEKMQLVATNRLGSEAFASPAVSGRRLLLRVASGKGEQRQEILYCIASPQS
ncbi:MAG: PQQ-binding-like beta-propeller repeat protein [Pirellulaceae bacterium]